MTTETIVKEWTPTLEITQATMDEPRFAVTMENGYMIPLTRADESEEWRPALRLRPTWVVVLSQMLRNGEFNSLVVAGGIPVSS